MADSFRNWDCSITAIAHRSASHHPIRHRGVRAKLLMAFLLPVSLAGCRKAPADNTPPDVIRQIVMKKWAIEPSRIEVPQGDEVELIVTTTDVEHGLAVPTLGIREPVQPGTSTIVRFKATTAGTYPMKCSVLCGRDHDKMTGEIVILPSSASH